MIPWLIELIHNHSQWFMIQGQFMVHHHSISPWLNMIELARHPRQINGCHSTYSLRYHSERDAQGLYQATCSSHELDYGAGSKHHESGWAEGSIHGEGGSVQDRDDTILRLRAAVASRFAGKAGNGSSSSLKISPRAVWMNMNDKYW